MKWNIQGQYEYHLTAQIMLAKTLTVKVYAAQSSKYKIQYYQLHCSCIMLHLFGILFDLMSNKHDAEEQKQKICEKNLCLFQQASICGYQN